jgi:hypothetical protein
MTTRAARATPTRSPSSLDIDRVVGHIGRHIARQGPKPEPNQCCPQASVYDIGENGDCSVTPSDQRPAVNADGRATVLTVDTADEPATTFP